MTPIAAIAIRAAENFHRWGKWATVRFCEKRGVPLRLLGMAVAFERIKNFWRRK